MKIVIGVAIASAVYLLLYLAYRLLKPVPAAVGADKMPCLRPLPIPTVKRQNMFSRLLVWIFEVRKWELEKPWTFTLQDGTTIVFNRGFTFDGASVPRPLWILLSPVGLLLIPGLIHDYGYRFRQLWQVTDDGSVEPYMSGQKRKHWDNLFRQVSRQVNGIAIVGGFAWLALKLFGCFAWKRCRKNEVPPTKPDLG